MQLLNRSLGVVTVVSASLVALAACGDGGGSAAVSKTSYLAKADAICKTFEKNSDELVDTSSEAAANQSITDKVVPAFKQQLDDIRALGYPDGDKDALNAMLDSAGKVADDIAKDPSEFVNSDKNPFADVNQKMQAYGFKECGNENSEDSSSTASPETTTPSTKADPSSVLASFGDTEFTDAQKNCLVKDMVDSIGVSGLQTEGGIETMSPQNQKAVIAAIDKCLNRDEQVKMMLPQLTKQQTKLTTGQASCYVGKLIDDLGLGRLFEYGQGAKPTDDETTRVLDVIHQCGIDPSAFTS